jgi:hypothetical protein
MTAPTVLGKVNEWRASLRVGDGVEGDSPRGRRKNRATLP